MKTTGSLLVKYDQSLFKSLLVLLLAGFISAPSHAQGIDTSAERRISVGLSLAIDWVHTKYHPDWDQTHYRNPTLYEDARRKWELDHAHFVLDGFVEMRLTTFVSAQARLGFTFLGMESPEYSPEVSLLAKFEFVKTSFLKAHVTAGFFLQRTLQIAEGGSWWISGISGGVGIELPFLPAIEVIILKPFVPLTYWPWRSRNGDYVDIPINHWFWRVGFVVPVWEF